MKRTRRRKPKQYPCPRWQSLRKLFNDDPGMTKLLIGVERLAGPTPPIVWLCAAIHGFSNPADPDFRQRNLIEYLCAAVGQECFMRQ